MIGQRAGAIPRGKYYETQTLRAPVQGSPLAASVRIRVKDSQGEDVGSGTIIDSRVGATFVLTCGHIFRNWDKTCVIEVDCSARGYRRFGGTRVYHNLEDDVGLISMNVDPLPSCRVAPAGTKLFKGSPVISVGCSGGEKPTEQTLKITALNRYLGADNIRCSGVPAAGPLGSGACSHATGSSSRSAPPPPRTDKEGAHAGLKDHAAVCSIIARWHCIAQLGAGQDQDQLAADLLEESEPDADDAGTEIADEVEPPGTPPIGENVAKKTESKGGRKAIAPAAAGDEAEIREALEQAGEAEIVCIIRPIHQPRAASRVVILKPCQPPLRGLPLRTRLDSQDDIRETTLTDEG